MEAIAKKFGLGNYTNISFVSMGVRPACILEGRGKGRTYIDNTIKLEQSYIDLIESIPNIEYCYYDNSHFVYNSYITDAPKYKTRTGLGIYLGYPRELCGEYVEGYKTSALYVDAYGYYDYIAGLYYPVEYEQIASKYLKNLQSKIGFNAQIKTWGG